MAPKSNTRSAWSQQDLHRKIYQFLRMHRLKCKIGLSFIKQLTISVNWRNALINPNQLRLLAVDFWEVNCLVLWQNTVNFLFKVNKLTQESLINFSFTGENRKLKVHQIFHEKGNMGKVLPEYLSEWTTERVREEGVNVIPSTQVQDVDLVNDQLKLKLLNGQTVLCDHVVVAAGSAPNINLAQNSGLEVDKTFGGYLVNAELEARRHVYVVGFPCFSFFNDRNTKQCLYFERLAMRHVFTMKNWDDAEWNITTTL